MLFTKWFERRANIFHNDLVRRYFCLNKARTSESSRENALLPPTHKIQVLTSTIVNRVMKAFMYKPFRVRFIVIGRCHFSFNRSNQKWKIIEYSCSKKNPEMVSFVTFQKSRKVWKREGERGKTADPWIINVTLQWVLKC